MENSTGKNAKKSPFRFKLEEEGQLKTLSIEELEKQFQFQYLFDYEYEKEKDQKLVFKKCEKALKTGEISNAQYWLGCYFQKEIREATLSDIIIKKISDQKGYGVIAARDFQPNEWVGEYIGRLCKKSVFKPHIYNAYTFQHLYSLDSVSNFLIDAKNQGNFTRFLNHKNQPNLDSKIVYLDSLTRVIFVTNRLIYKGEELCYHYGDFYWKFRKKPCD